MAERGDIHFAHVAREVAEAALPRYRSPFSKHTFTHPTLLAILCLMRQEDWTYREPEVRLREHAELQAALALTSERVPDDTTPQRCLRRIGADEVTHLAHETVRRMQPPSADGTTVAVNGTGPAPGAISTFFVNCAHDRGEGLTWRHWRKWVVVVDLPQRCLLAQVASRAKPGPTNDGATLRPCGHGWSRCATLPLFGWSWRTASSTAS